jgi:1-pyrroline-5-carboxylate dehydrogenase
MDSISLVPAPINEPVRSYAPGTAERAGIEARIKALAAEQVDVTVTIDGVQRTGSGEDLTVVMPHSHRHVLAAGKAAGARDAADAIAAAGRASRDWQALPFDERAAVFLKAADLLTGPWRDTLNGATMLGQSKTVYQAEIDSACELADFWRFNVHFARQILAEQPIANSPGVWNRLDHRPLEGFVYAVTPFNFTAIAGNLPTAPALMGNTVLWKPSTTQLFAAQFLMRLLEEAGLPAGVINLLPGAGPEISDVVLAHQDLAGIHFTGSTPVFQHLWRSVGNNIANFRTYPRLVGETGGKDFVLAHPSADPDVLRTALIRGAFEYQGQKCSAASRSYVPRSVWKVIKDDLASEVQSITVGDISDLSNFMGAVIDDRAFARHKRALDRANGLDSIDVAAGGTYDDSHGYFVRPTLLVSDDPTDEIFRDEYFGPILSVHVYDDSNFDSVITQVDEASPYALTGSIIARDRGAVTQAVEGLRNTAGNFYINDKPTGAVVGQQPFGGARASGTNDKAGAPQNLQRWTSTRTIKETFVAPKDWKYAHMDAE